MKCFKIIIAICCFVLLFALPVRAESTDVIGDIYSLLPDESKDIFYDEGFRGDNSEWIEELDAASFFSLIISFFKEGISSPLSALSKTLSVLVLCSLMTSYSSYNNVGAAVDSVCTVSTALILAVPIYEIIAAAKQALSGVSVFMSGAVPVFAAVKAAAGKPVSVTGSAGVLLFACQILSYLCAFLFVPFMNSYLALGICSSFGGKNATEGIMNSIKKISMWVLSLCTTVFLFILGVKGVVGKGTDTLAMKTAKFVLGTTVPVVGTALSESASGVAAGLSALSGTAGIYIIFGVCIIMLPLLAQLVCWRLALILIKYLSVLFSVKTVDGLSQALESVLSLLLGFCLLALALLIISSGVLISL